MKRLMEFKKSGENYVLEESEQVLFSINCENLKFDSKKFYENIYKNKSTNIELSNKISDDSNGNYIFQWLEAIVKAIKEEFSEDDVDNNEEDITSSQNVIPLYNMAACAGDGLFTEGTIESTDYPTDNPEADYAVKISGKSMEPTILDGDIVLVKKTQELKNNDIGIFNVDGNTMCKRYLRHGKGEKLVPDNKSGEFEEIKKSTVENCIIQGKVLIE